MPSHWDDRDDLDRHAIYSALLTRAEADHYTIDRTLTGLVLEQDGHTLTYDVRSGPELGRATMTVSSPMTHEPIVLTVRRSDSDPTAFRIGGSRTNLDVDSVAADILQVFTDATRHRP